MKRSRMNMMSEEYSAEEVSACVSDNRT